MSSGPFQTAVNQLLGMTAGAVAGVKKIVKDERQDRQEQDQAAKKIQENGIQAFKAEEERDVEADKIAAKAYRQAQDRGLASPNRIMFDENGNPLATYDELAQIMADSSLSQNLSSSARSVEAVKHRKEMLMNKEGAKL